MLGCRLRARFDRLVKRRENSPGLERIPSMLFAKCVRSPYFPAQIEVLSLTNSEQLHKVRSIAFSYFVPYKVPSMKNVYEVLRQKELELARLEKEVEALRDRKSVV